MIAQFPDHNQKVYVSNEVTSPVCTSVFFKNYDKKTGKDCSRCFDIYLDVKSKNPNVQYIILRSLSGENLIGLSNRHHCILYTQEEGFLDTRFSGEEERKLLVFCNREALLDTFGGIVLPPEKAEFVFTVAVTGKLPKLKEKKDGFKQPPYPRKNNLPH